MVTQKLNEQRGLVYHALIKGKTLTQLNISGRS